MTDPTPFVSAPVVEVVLRRWAGDCLLHAYLHADLEDDNLEFVVSVGHEFPHPALHRRSALSDDLPPLPGACWDDCPACGRWRRHNPHTILVGGEVRA